MISRICFLLLDLTPSEKLTSKKKKIKFLVFFISQKVQQVNEISFQIMVKQKKNTPLPYICLLYSLRDCHVEDRNRITLYTIKEYRKLQLSIHHIC